MPYNRCWMSGYLVRKRASWQFKDHGVDEEWTSGNKLIER